MHMSRPSSSDVYRSFGGNVKFIGGECAFWHTGVHEAFGLDIDGLDHCMILGAGNMGCIWR
jgi:hypothetical protein